MRLQPAYALAALLISTSASVFSSPLQVTRAPPPVMTNPEPQPNGTLHREQYSALEFNVWTGDDDLRSMSVVWVDLKFPDGVTQRCFLHAVMDDGWANNSKHQGRQCILSTAKNWNQLRAVRMVMGLDGSLRELSFDTPDNWNVNRVRVIAIDAADKHYPCLLDAMGSPFLVRMTKIQASYDLTETENRC